MDWEENSIVRLQLNRGGSVAKSLRGWLDLAEQCA